MLPTQQVITLLAKSLQITCRADGAIWKIGLLKLTNFYLNYTHRVCIIGCEHPRTLRLQHD